eukprot:jgi/Phyca11/19853/fgenesh1_pg.PHYCAscaffold_53_\
MSSEASEDSAASVASEISDVSRLGNGVQEAESPEAHVPAARASQTSAPLLQDRYFDTWDDFFDCLAAFQDGTHQVFKKRASTTTAARNKDLVKRGNASKTTTTPPSFDRYYRRFVCTHGKNVTLRDVHNLVAKL